MTLALQKSDLRRTLREKRRALTKAEQVTAAKAIIQVIKPALVTHKIKRIALYTAMDGEVDLGPFIEFCWQHGIQVFLPIVHQLKPKLWFARYEPESILTNNRFGIGEPLRGEPLRPWQLDLVLLPLVGFDETGGRLGMGGGFYDRTFAQASHWPKRPRMVGVAHECQKVDNIPLEPWDIKLDAIFTDKQAYPAK